MTSLLLNDAMDKVFQKLKQKEVRTFVNSSATMQLRHAREYLSILECMREANAEDKTSLEKWYKKTHKTITRKQQNQNQSNVPYYVKLFVNDKLFWCQTQICIHILKCNYMYKDCTYDIHICRSAGDGLGPITYVDVNGEESITRRYNNESQLLEKMWSTIDGNINTIPPRTVKKEVYFPAKKRQQAATQEEVPKVNRIVHKYYYGEERILKEKEWREEAKNYWMQNKDRIPPTSAQDFARNQETHHEKAARDFFETQKNIFHIGNVLIESTSYVNNGDGKEVKFDTWREWV